MTIHTKTPDASKRLAVENEVSLEDLKLVRGGSGATPVAGGEDGELPEVIGDVIDSNADFDVANGGTSGSTGNEDTGASGSVGGFVGAGGSSDSTSASGAAGVGGAVEGEAHADLGEGFSGSASGGASGLAGASGSAHADSNSAGAGAEAGVFGEAHGDIDVTFGDADGTHGTVGAGGQAFVGAGGHAEAGVNFGDGQFGAEGSVGGFAGAGAMGEGVVGGGVDNVGSGSVSGGGGRQDRRLGRRPCRLHDGNIEFGLEGALGLGLKIGFDVSLDTHHVQEGAKAVAGAVADGATGCGKCRR
ncbi:MAG: hypothetical protein R3D33_10035 [Hyphomicrobiaceae bacterium]